MRTKLSSSAILVLMKNSHLSNVHQRVVLVAFGLEGSRTNFARFIGQVHGEQFARIARLVPFLDRRLGGDACADLPSARRKKKKLDLSKMGKLPTCSDTV